MRILTLTQPWASLIAIGAKTLETRSWRTGYRGPLAIHYALCHMEPFRSVLRPHFARVADLSGRASRPAARRAGALVRRLHPAAIGAIFKEVQP